MSTEHGSSSFPVLGVKALQGGPEALIALLASVPEDSRLCFVVVLPETAAALKRLREHLRLPVVEITEPSALRPGHVYVLPPDRWAYVRASVLHLQESELAPELLRRSRERFAKIFRLGPFASFLLSEKDLRITDVNESFCTITGYKAREVIGRTILQLHLFHAGPAPEELRRKVRAGTFKEQELILHTKNGTFSNVVASGEHVEVDDTPHIIMTFIDVTERRTLERQVQTVAERELHRIGQDLHDTLGQLLIGITYQARQLLREVDPSDASLYGKLTALVDQSEEAAQFTRNFSQLLSPMDVGEHYLEGALNLLCHHTTEMFGLPCHLDVRIERPPRNEIVVNSLYRIAQEAVLNAARHANANNVYVHLRREEDVLTLRVEDDGEGITEEDIALPTGMGLRAMRYRANLIGAQLTIRRRPVSGTEVHCQVDLNDVPETE